MITNILHEIYQALDTQVNNQIDLVFDTKIVNPNLYRPLNQQLYIHFNTITKDVIQEDTKSKS